ncbi:ABC transporter permease [Paenibacillus arenilitoris]|uniref:ABC transporter permease n=1 Tax=Paenibacillus arenilitoris TaxID=2772299 RepID=A0A927CNX0_9BACL|nr:ABC transporter permease [Paenibacillus arenilitoris]MBD2870068.1 ABC transporter permease [Paenibacillus arenilitoris]
MIRVWLTTAYYELVKYGRMKSVLVILIGLPLLLILLLGSAFDTDLKPAKVALYVADQGELSGSIGEFWNGEAIKPFVFVLKTDSGQEVEDYVTEGIADYGVYVPADFSQKVLAGEKAVWKTFSGRYAEKNVAADAVIGRYMAELNLKFAAMATLGTDAPVRIGNADARRQSLVAIGNLGNTEDRLFGETSAMQYYAAAYLIMFLLFSGMSAALALLGQKEDGTLRRLYAMPSSFRAAVFGVVTGAVMLACLQSLVVIVFTKYVYDVEWSGHYLAIAAVCLLTTAAGTGLAIIVASVAGTSKSTQTLFTILVTTMTFLSGGMMAGIQNMVGIASKLTINHWANISLRAIMSGSDAAAAWNAIGVLAAIAAVLSLIAIFRLPKVVMRHA